ncbi:predicted protein [Uncinocarpus reesii 1704]|uniref:BZIP domain-containing protein n=1 Tax=Uncinocarpus reesii (strain UAMH 1704) TaxID=336963 RepID=C4JZH5_UNCRE|nr:uncharacterized protein UREG_07576 [Uncinocarpus reesii 1704]EEP82711.1 predicted protein [Uncinocarpus reesii 1704]
MYSTLVPEWQLDLLSADSFPNAPQVQSYRSMTEHGSQIFFGAHMPLAPAGAKHQGAIDGETPAVPRSKKKKTSQKPAAQSRGRGHPPADEGSRRRGRPRVHTGDETSAEIRLAQRAYRLRKEAVITTLNQRVERLESTIDEMNKTFLAFNDDALAAGILSTQPEIAQRLRRATQRFLELMSEVSRDSDEEAHGESKQSNTTPTDTSETQPASNASGILPLESSGKVSNALTTSHENKAAPQTNNQICRQQTTMAANSDSTLESNTFPTSAEDLQSLISCPSLFPRDTTVYQQYSYCFQETTFCRRLQRRCLEYGYAALVDPYANPEELHDAFKFTFGIVSRDKLVEVFHSLIQRKAGEPLELWNKPFFYIGSAGMHYPYHDEFGNVIFPPNMHPPERALGPLPFHSAERPHSHKSVAELIDAIGFGGEWFDCHDVEGYLLEKGIKLTSQSSYAYVPIWAVPGQLSGISSPLTNSPSGSYNTDTSFFSNTISSPGSQPDFPSQAMNTNSEIRYPFQNEVCSQMLGLLGLDHDPTLRLGGPIKQATSYPTETYDASVTLSPWVLDVDKFVTYLCRKAVCLGRAPGLRKSHVDDALYTSICRQY